MNTTEQQRLQAKIDELQAELDALKDSEPEVDWSKMAGRLVMVRDDENHAWTGPVVYSGFLHNGRTLLPHRINGYVSWKYAKPYTGPTRPNWIWHDGDKMPVDGDTEVYVQFRDGRRDEAIASCYIWTHQGQYDDIMRYTIIEP